MQQPSRPIIIPCGSASAVHAHIPMCNDSCIGGGIIYLLLPIWNNGSFFNMRFKKHFHGLTLAYTIPYISIRPMKTCSTMSKRGSQSFASMMGPFGMKIDFNLSRMRCRRVMKGNPPLRFTWIVPCNGTRLFIQDTQDSLMTGIKPYFMRCTRRRMGSTTTRIGRRDGGNVGWYQPQRHL